MECQNEKFYFFQGTSGHLPKPIDIITYGFLLML